MSALPCTAYEIETLDFALVFAQVVELFRIDQEQRRRLTACTPLPWDTAAPYGADL